MVRKGGFRRSTRGLYTKNVRDRGKVSQKKYLQDFKEGDIVSIGLEPAVSEGSAHPKFVGKTATVIKKEGSCYRLKVKDREKFKEVVIHPVHLKK